MPDKNVNLTSLGKASFPDLKTPARWHEDPARAAAGLMADGSLEFSSGDAGQVAELTGLLPFGTPVFVPVLPLHPLNSRLELIRELRAAGFDPVPHIAARRMPSNKALVTFLSEAHQQAQVHRVLLIGGDSKTALGPFEDALSLLQAEILPQAGIREVGFAAYPEGHPNLPQAQIWQALLDKLALAADQGMGSHVVTQFSFMPQRIIEFCTELAGRAPGVPVYVGIAGPAKLGQLVHFARYCGVSASLSAVRKVGVKLAQLMDHQRADEQLASLARFTASHDSSNIIGVHVFGFGGVTATAQWMHDHLNS